MREDIKELIKTNKICVLGTVAGNEPHCSLMSYAASDECDEIYLATHKNTKKYRNLCDNPAVSILIDSRQTAGNNHDYGTKALTVKGTRQSGRDEQNIEAARKVLCRLHPDLKDFFADPDAAIIIVQVRAVQLLDGITNAYFEEIK